VYVCFWCFGDYGKSTHMLTISGMVTNASRHRSISGMVTNASKLEVFLASELKCCQVVKSFVEPQRLCLTRNKAYEHFS
jgi:hypothetical protein